MPKNPDKHQTQNLNINPYQPTTHIPALRFFPTIPSELQRYYLRQANQETHRWELPIGITFSVSPGNYFVWLHPIIIPMTYPLNISINIYSTNQYIHYKSIPLKVTYISVQTHAVCCPKTINIEDVALSNMIGKMPENTEYTQCFLVWDSEFSGFRFQGLRLWGFRF